MNTLTHAAVTEHRPLLFTQLTLFAVILLIVAVLWGQFDERVLDGVSVWVKPAKFSLSFVVHFATLAIIVAALSEVNRQRRRIALAGGVMAVAFIAEMAYIVFQAAQGEHSHFNLSTPFHQTLYSLMGLGALLLIGMPVLVASVARHDPQLGPATQSGIWWGALVSFAFTLVTAGYLSNQGGHFVGIPNDPTRVLPIVGWSTEVGDLRPAHFLSLHALQVLPLLGVWVDRTARSHAWIKPLALAYALLCLLVFGQSLLGLPLISM